MCSRTHGTSAHDHQADRLWARVGQQVEWTQKNDPESWADYVADTELFDNACADGLEPEDFSVYEVPAKSRSPSA